MEKRTEEWIPTPSEFLAVMKAVDELGDGEESHRLADLFMCTVLERLGYSDGVKVFLNMERWYA